MLFIYFNFNFSVSSNFIVTSACSNLLTSFRKSMSASPIEDGYEALFIIAIFCSCGYKVTVKTFSIFVFFNHFFLFRVKYFVISCVNLSILI